MFGYFKKRRQLAIQKQEQEHELALKKVARIKADVKLVTERAEKKSVEFNKLHNDEYEGKNNICPSCKSTNVNQRIKRQQGNINGENYSNREGFGFLTLNHSKSSSYGYIKGELDTNPVNKCNDCQHEWKVTEHKSKWSEEVIKDYIHWTIMTLKKYHDAKHCKFNPLDVNEKYSSLEEKQKALLLDAQNHFITKWPRELFEGTTTDTFKHLIAEHCKYGSDKLDYTLSHDEAVMLEIGFVKMDI